MARPTLEFVKAALRNPMEVSTLFPTSKYLATKMIELAGADHAERVIELGTGTGAITQHLLPRLRQPQNYLGVELDAKMASFMREHFPQLRFENGLAESLQQWVAPSSVDVVVSSLPWTLLSDDTQKRTLYAIKTALKPSGTFATYICANALLYPLAKTFRHNLSETFQTYERSGLEWRNVPPAYVFTVVKDSSLQ